MGTINLIKGDKKNKVFNRKFMVSLTFDIWASDHKEATLKLADYLECVLTDKFDKKKFSNFKRPFPAIVVEATELDIRNTCHTLDNGIEFGMK